MTKQTASLSKRYLKRWKCALKCAAKLNRKLKKNKGSVLYDLHSNTIDCDYVFKIETDEYGISWLGFIGDNDPEADNGIMYSTLEEIKEWFKGYKVLIELKD